MTDTHENKEESGGEEPVANSGEEKSRREVMHRLQLPFVPLLHHSSRKDEMRLRTMLRESEDDVSNDKRGRVIE